jgi:hypothetical protein
MRAAPLFLGLALAVLPSQLTAQDQAIQAGRQYQAGTRVASPLTGVSFVVPDGFVGMYDAEGQAFVMGSQAQQGLLVAVYAYSEAGLEDIGEQVDGILSNQGITLVPQSEGELTDTTASGTFVAMSQQGQGMLYGAARTGGPGNAVLVAAARMGQSADGLKEIVEGVMGSMQLGPAGAQQWRQAVAGGLLSTTASGSDMSTGGGATATGASQSWSTIDLCSDGQYAYQERSETYISIEGASASNESSDEHVGMWWLVSDIIGNGMLVLEATDGRYFQWSVREEGNTLNVESKGAPTTCSAASGATDGYRPILNVSPAVSRSWAIAVPLTLERHPPPPQKMLPVALMSVNMSRASVRIPTRSFRKDLAPRPNPPEKRHSLDWSVPWGLKWVAPSDPIP